MKVNIERLRARTRGGFGLESTRSRHRESNLDNILLATRKNDPWPASLTFSSSLNTLVLYRDWFFKQERGSYFVHSINRLWRP